LRLIGFKYLTARRILTLALILTLASTLFSITAFSLLGFYRGFNAYLGEEEDIVAIYDRKSRTPFTGLVPMYLAERMASINGVLASSPEAIAPCMVRGEFIFVRGIVPREFSKLNPLNLVEGKMLELNDLNLAIVGRRLAERFMLKLGDKLLVLGVLTDRCLELEVKGVYESQSTMDDECLAPIYVGQWLRGTDYNHVTLIRVKIDRNRISPIKLFDDIAKEASEPSPGDGGIGGQDEGIIPTTKTSFRVEDVGVEEAQKFMKDYLNRYGVTREALLILSIMVFFFASASVAGATKALMHQHRHEIEILRSVGASNRTIKTDLLFKVLGWSLAASAAGVVLAAVTLVIIEVNGYLQVLSHRVFFHLDPLIVTLNFILVSLLVALSILRSDLKSTTTP